MPSTRDAKKSFLQGYEEGLRDGFSEVLRLTGKGHTAMEVAVLVKSKMAVLDRSVEAMAERLESGEVALEGASPAEAALHRITERGSYLVSEARPEGLYRILKSLEEQDVPALCVTRTHPRELEEKYHLGKTQFLWLTQSVEGGKGKAATTSATNLVGLISAVDQFLKGTEHAAVAVEGVEYLSSQNGFDATLRCLQQVNEKARAREAYLFVSVDPTSLGAREYGLLAREIPNEV